MTNPELDRLVDRLTAQLAADDLVGLICALDDGRVDLYTALCDQLSRHYPFVAQELFGLPFHPTEDDVWSK